MEKIKIEEVGRKRGRPKLDARITEEYAPSRRQALNKMYMYEGVYLLSVAATEIPNSEVLWQEDRTAVTVKSRDGILEQLGRMAMQNKLAYTDCVYLANLAIAAVQNGYTTREVEVVLRKIRMAAKSSIKNPDSEALYCALGNAVDILRSMGGIA
ncbi:hypothetical protein [uncultured Oscillibacter sp.]|uniref:hypothetical protein n=1 Tax=uncultured Oscillibacter sp. TaxID=876091 RepID=UPI002729FB67|nr:hypothetical protein [uncultured Oscillibacter sp.]